MIDHAQLRGELQTGLGWKWQVLGTDSINSISNWPMQSNGAEMLRIACCLATERGIEVCTPVHDALLVQAPVEAIQEVRAATKECMEEASAIVLKGARLKIGIDDPVAYPARFSDARGVEMWRTLTQLLEGLENPKV